MIEDSDRYDYILIDSRTGFSDEGSICTRVLGDYLLVLTGLNRQNVRGTARFLDQSDVVEREESLALVASPVPMYYEDLRAERIDAAKERISERAGLEEVRFVSQIPYHPVLALEEDPTVRSLQGTDLFESYEEITERLRTWAGDRPEEQVGRIPGLLQSGEEDLALSVFRDVRKEDPETALRFLRSTARLLREDHLGSVISLLEEGLDTAHKLGDSDAKGALLSSLGNRYGEWGDSDQAIRFLKQALNHSRRTGNREKEMITLNNLGYWHLEGDMTEQAVEFLTESEELAREVGNQSVLASALVNLGTCFARQRKRDRALKTAEEAAVIAENLDHPSFQSKIHLSRARVLSHLDHRQALKILRKRWDLIQENVDAFEKMEAHVLRARLRLEVEDDAEGAADDAQTALDFYRERDVDSRWSREVEEILEKAQRRIE